MTAADILAHPFRVTLPPALLRAAVAMVVALCAAVGAGMAVEHLAFLSFGDRFVTDWETAALLPSEPPDAAIVVVAINEDTLASFPYRSPIDRRFLADLLTTIAARSPRAIGLDLLLDQPTEPDKDEALRRTLDAIKVPLRVSYVDGADALTERQRAWLDDFVPPRMRALATLGTDQFDTVRWIFPGQKQADGSYVPGLARALAGDLGVTSPARLADIVWHGRPNGDVPAFREYPAQLVATLPAAWFKDKIVLIGSDLSLTDRHRTPFTTIAEGSQAMMPGVVVHAHSLAQILERRRAFSVGRWANLAVVLGCAMIGAMLPAFGGSMMLRVGAGVVVLGALWVGGGALFHYSNVMIGLVAPTLALAASHWAMEAFAGHEARRQREFIKGAFSRYVSPKVVEALIADPAKMSLDGERRVMTHLFTDLADFTTMSEMLDSKALAHTLNGYLDGVSTVVLKYDGTIGKFEGDAVFVIFNAPVDQPDHADRTVHCALEIDRYAEAYRVEQNAKGIPFGKTRIGIHTGSAVVGNFGSSTRFDYSANGDAVNTAARLEGVNKQFGTRICVSEATRMHCQGIRFRPLGSVVVKGKTTGIAVWEPLHEPAGDEAYLARFDAAYEKLANGAPEALDLFQALHREAPDDKCVSLHLDRLSHGETGAEIVLTEK